MNTPTTDSKVALTGKPRRFDILIEGEVVDGAICHFDLSRHFQKMGIDSSVLGLSGAPGLPDNFLRVDAAQLASVDCWQARGTDAVLAYGLCLSEPVARAVAQAGVML